MEGSVALRDPARLAAVRATALLDSPREETFDRLTRLASKVIDVPVAMVVLLDEDRQFFKSCIGLKEPWTSKRETPLSHSFCQHAVESREPLIIDDAREHPLVCTNLAILDLDVIAYAGFPLITAEGEALGTFCAIDTKPRQWSEDEVDFVREMAASAMTEIELRTTVRQLEDARAEVEGTAMTLRELQAISDVALANLDTEDLLRELLGRVASALDVDVAAILLSEGDGALALRAARGIGEGDERELKAAAARALDGPARDGGPALIEGLEDGIATLLAAPVGAANGLLAVGSRSGRRFTADEVKLLELAAERAGHAIHNARLYERAQSEAQELEAELVRTLQRQGQEAGRAAAERRELLTHVVHAQEDERRRIAADMHDDYLQALAAVRMRLEGLAEQSPEAAALAADVGATTERMRGLVFDLRPPALDWAGVGSALRLLLEATRERCGIRYELESRLDAEPPEAVRVDAYRIAQEAVANVCKHAEASRIEIALAPLDGGVHVSIADDGTGMPAEPRRAHSFGLSGMRERAEAAGGWLRVDSTPGEGTTVEFWLPAAGAG